MKAISVVMRYYNQPLMLRHQLGVIASYSETVRQHLYLIFVDDGSPIPAEPIIRESGLLSSAATIRLYRSLVDIPWNQEFATNLGVAHTETQWFLHLDIDHEAPPETMQALITEAHDPTCYYLFQRRLAGPVDMLTPHYDGLYAPGLWFMTKDVFDRADGLDERFAGRYLPSDRDFRVRLIRAQAQTIFLPHYLLVHDENRPGAIPDASAVCGDVPGHVVDAEGEALYEQILANRGRQNPTIRLSFPWERVL
jgi:hypothetical protein